MLDFEQFDEINQGFDGILEKLMMFISEDGELMVDDYLTESVFLATTFISKAVLQVAAEDRQLFKSYLQGCLEMIAEQEVDPEVFMAEVH